MLNGLFTMCNGFFTRVETVGICYYVYVDTCCCVYIDIFYIPRTTVYACACACACVQGRWVGTLLTSQLCVHGQLFVKFWSCSLQH